MSLAVVNYPQQKYLPRNYSRLPITWGQTNKGSSWSKLKLKINFSKPVAKSRMFKKSIKTITLFNVFTYTDCFKNLKFTTRERIDFLF